MSSSNNPSSNPSSAPLDDLPGYRRDIMSVASDSSSPFRQKWTNGTLLYDMPPEEVLTVLSEKYLALTPKVIFLDKLRKSELPFVNPELADPEVWERELIKDHRQATLAKLEGKSVGDVRREDDRAPVERIRQGKQMYLSF